MRYSRAALVVTLFIALSGAPAQAGQAAARPSFDELIETLRTGNGYQRARVIALFSRLDDPRVVPELVALLHDEDARVRVSTAQQLARLADRQTADALAKALADANGNVRRYAAEGLAKIGEERHVPALVASVMNHLPDPNTSPNNVVSSSAALTAIAALSSTAPAELIALVAKVSDGENVTGEAWWRLLADAAGCLGQIGDKAAHETLLRTRKKLETDHPDYKTWCAVRKALAAIDPENMPFDRPAAGILESWASPFKMSAQDIRHKWVLPLAELSDEAVDDLAWALQFESEWDRRRSDVAVETLGEIRGNRAAGALRRYVKRQSRVPETERREKRPPIRAALLALLKADPNEATVREVVLSLQLLDMFEQEYLVHDVSRVSSEIIPGEVKTAFCRAVLLGSSEAKDLDMYAEKAAIRLLGQIGGPQAGEVLGATLLNSPAWKWKEAAARALGTIRGYDAIPALTKASTLRDVTKETIAWAFGMIADPRAIPVLKDMAARSELRQQDRVWIAAALARLDVDYGENADLIRKALPDTLEQAEWLHDDESIQAVATFLHAEERRAERAIHTLGAIGTDAAFNALIARIDLETVTDPMHLEQLTAAAGRMAEKLGRPDAAYWAGVATTVAAVRDGFILSQRVEPPVKYRRSFEVVARNAALARKVWIAEAVRRLDLAAKGKVEPHHSSIPREAVSGAEAIYGPEMGQALERISKENTAGVDFHGKDGIVRYFHVRSLAARILTEKTGQPYMFVDVDGRTHPGGWDPSQDDSQFRAVIRPTWQ